MEITYNFELKDWTAASKELSKKNKAGIKTTYFSIALLFLINFWDLLIAFPFMTFDQISIFFGSSYFWESVFWRTIWTLAALPIFFIFNYFFTSVYLRFAVPKKSLAIIGQQTVILREDELISISDVSTTNVNWRAFEQIAETAEYIFFYLAPTNAFVIPKRSFSNEQHGKAFLETAQNYFVKAKSSFAPSHLANWRREQ